MRKQQDPRKTFGAIFIAMLLACAVYCFLGYVVVSHPNHAAPQGMESFKSVLAIVAAVTLAIGMQWPRFALTDDKILAKGSKRSAMNYVLICGINSLACLEAVAVFGLMWTIISLELKHLPYTSGLAALAILYQRTQIMSYFDKAEKLFPKDK
jgi:hypothetical protein